MIARIVLSVVVAVITGLVCILLGGILSSLNVPITETVGNFLRAYAWVLGILAGLWFYFTGRTAILP